MNWIVMAFIFANFDIFLPLHETTGEVIVPKAKFLTGASTVVTVIVGIVPLLKVT